jgi:hypothetical protein
MDWDALVEDTTKEEDPITKEKKRVVIDWKDETKWKGHARNSVIKKLLPDFQPLNNDKPPDSKDLREELALYCDNLYVWPENARDIDKVTGVKKSNWRNKNVSDLEQLVIKILEDKSGNLAFNEFLNFLKKRNALVKRAN